MQKKFLSLSRPLSILFIVLTILFVSVGKQMAAKNISLAVVISANSLLYFVSMINLYFQFRNIHHPNPNAVVRGVIAGTFIKLFLLATAVMVYLLVAKATRNVNGVFVGMGLYIIYTWLEVRISLRLNPKK